MVARLLLWPGIAYLDPIGLGVPLHQDSDGLRFTTVPWGYAPYLPKGKRRRKDGMPIYFAAVGQLTRREGIATRPG